MELEGLDENADQFLTDMSSILSVLVEAHAKQASFFFHDYDSRYEPSRLTCVLEAGD